jgi:predicted nucleotidyltransferase component of viral defense system
MINLDTIQSLATKLQTRDINIAREYIQNLFLSFFYAQKESSNILFKGGTALRIVFQSPRFSEDLDFSTNKFFSLKEIEQIIIKTIGNIEHLGIKTNIKESKATSGDYLGIINFKFLEYSIDVFLEISFREKTGIKGETVVVNNSFIPSYILVILAQDQMVAEKIQATLTRQKPRDFFDIYFLLRGNMIAVDNKASLKPIKDIIEKTKINFSNELKVFLPFHQQLIIKDFKSNLLREINKI